MSVASSSEPIYFFIDDLLADEEVERFWQKMKGLVENLSILIEELVNADLDKAQDIYQEMKSIIDKKEGQIMRYYFIIASCK